MTGQDEEQPIQLGTGSGDEPVVVAGCCGEACDGALNFFHCARFVKAPHQDLARRRVRPV